MYVETMLLYILFDFLLYNLKVKLRLGCSFLGVTETMYIVLLYIFFVFRDEIVFGVFAGTCYQRKACVFV